MNKIDAEVAGKSIKHLPIEIIMSLLFMILPILDARADILTKFVCFWEN